MSDVAVSIKGLGKRYLMPNWTNKYARSFGSHIKEFLGPLAGVSDQDYFWALKDVSFDVKQGEVLGILGKNGSGKSTLLKVLSRVTDPTEGFARMRGKVGSLLEVGTGFHPDLTGRENIFMNGALLGMSQQEIRRKFDAIVSFSGIEEFLDVPVKRYSSGMYVRLAYAVTSHLDTDVLIVDEVLAVGDAEFSQKSMNNMKQVANDGRAVLFVSHNSAAIRNLCSHGVVLSHGRVAYEGSADEAVTHYMKHIHHVNEADVDYLTAPTTLDLRHAAGFDDKRPHPTFTEVSLMKGDGTPTRIFAAGEDMVIRMTYDAEYEARPYFCVFFLDMAGERVMTLYSTHDEARFSIKGKGMVECRVPDLRLMPGEYSLMLDFGRLSHSAHSVDCVPNAVSVQIVTNEYLNGRTLAPNQAWFMQRSHWKHVVSHADTAKELGRGHSAAQRG